MVVVVVDAGHPGHVLATSPTREPRRRNGEARRKSAPSTVGEVIALPAIGGTPWHPRHLAERYGLLTLITLGEAVIGTVAAMSALVHNPAFGWTVDAVVVLAAGILLTFGMWWTYFMIRWADLLATPANTSNGSADKTGCQRARCRAPVGESRRWNTIDLAKLGRLTIAAAGDDRLLVLLSPLGLRGPRPPSIAMRMLWLVRRTCRNCQRNPLGGTHGEAHLRNQHLAGRLHGGRHRLLRLVDA
jgi:hypothetical protein